MEEWVGKAWHKLIDRAARREYPEAEVLLDDVRHSVAVLFRALGGDGGLRVDSARAGEHGSKRRWLERIAGSGRTVELAWRDEETLRLPGRIAWFSDRTLNRDLYIWLAALAAQPIDQQHDWLLRSAGATHAVLQRYPALQPRYQKLVDAHIAQRPGPDSLSREAGISEQMIRHALLYPQAVNAPFASTSPPSPVVLWLHPQPPLMAPDTGPTATPDPAVSSSKPTERIKSRSRKRGERVDDQQGNDGLLVFRLESLFSRAEYVNVDRPDDEEIDSNAQSALDDLDQLSLSKSTSGVAAKLRFDLDLPSRANDDVYLGEGIPIPEWDYKRAELMPAHCRLQTMVSRDESPEPLPVALRTRVKRVQRIFEQLRSQREWRDAQEDGSELDLPALTRHMVNQRRGSGYCDTGVFRQHHHRERDLACLLLADLSLSTNAHVDDQRRVIDVIRDSLLIFAEALSVVGDDFALHGFSSRHRSHVRFNTLKAFEEQYGDESRARIQSIKPGYYTRMGAAIRHASSLLDSRKTAQKLLLLLTDGKPNDLDRYEGRYGIEDTRMAIIEARRRGLIVFCVSIDDKADQYLPYLFGSNAYVHIKNTAELSARLPVLYASLTV